MLTKTLSIWVFLGGGLFSAFQSSAEAVPSPSGPVASYRLTGPGAEEKPWRDPTTATSGLEVSPLIRGPGLIVAGLTNGFSSTRWSNDFDHDPPLPPTRRTALAMGDYFEFTVTIKKGYAASFSSLDVYLRRSGLGAPESFEWQYSLDGFQSNGTVIHPFQYFGRASGTAPVSHPPYAYHQTDLAGQDDGNPMETIDLSGIDALQRLSAGDAVTFRLYGWGADRNSRTVAMGRTSGPALGGKVYPVMPHALRWQNPDEAFQLVWNSMPGHDYTLRKSVDLRTWVPVIGYPLRAQGEAMGHFPSMEAEAAFFHVVTAGLQQGQVIEAYFSVGGPTFQEEDLTLEDKLIQFLEMAEPGSTVRAAIYTWSRSRMAEAFVAAQNRGVDVRIVYGGDGANDGTGYQAEKTLRDGLPEGHFLLCPDGDVIHGSCHGTGINHNKFFLFSSLSDGSENVVVQSSANLTNPQIRSFNNMVVIRGDSELFNAYQSYWTDLSTNTQNLNYYRSVEVESGAKAFFFPRREANGTTGDKDPVAEILEELAIKLGFAVLTSGSEIVLIPENVPAGGPKAEIHVGMAFWTNLRVGIAQRLVALHENGVVVRVSTSPSLLGAEVVDTLTEAGIPFTILESLHSKYMLINYEADGRRYQQVFTGSHNFTSPALRSNDEVLLRISDPGIYQGFLDDWNRMQEHPLIQSGYSN